MATKSKILVVNDEDTICEVLKLNLEMAGYDVDTANSAEAAMKKPLADYDLYIIDVMMGEMNGFDFASKIRATEALKEIPIIICTAKDSEEDLLDGFSRGIDDYVKKPFSIRELVVRIKSVLRRTKGGDTEQVPSSLTCNTLVLDAEKKLCTIDGEEVPLTKKEFEILRLFLQNRGRIFSREEILGKVWEEDVLVIDRTIDVNINRLRKKLKQYGNNIITKLGYGYGFKD